MLETLVHNINSYVHAPLYLKIYINVSYIYTCKKKYIKCLDVIEIVGIDLKPNGVADLIEYIVMH